MKYFNHWLVFFLICCFFLFNLTYVHSTKAQPTPIVNRTTIAGIIPLNNNNIEITEANIILDFSSKTSIDIDRESERSAKLKMTYNIKNNSGNNNVRFILPMLSKLKFCEDFDVMIDDKKIKYEIYPSNSTNFFRQGNYTELINNIDISTYLNNFYIDYQLTNDVDGYMYTINNPKTKGKNYFTDTSFIIKGASSDTFFLDMQGFHAEDAKIVTYGAIYKSEEIDVFFSSRELELEVTSVECIKRNGVYESNGKKITSATIDKEPMKLSKYIESQNSIENKTISDAFKSSLFKTIDDKIENDDSNKNFQLALLKNSLMYTYQELAVGLDVAFNEGNELMLEITTSIPVHFMRDEFTLDFVINPNNVFDKIGLESIKIVVNEDCVSATHNYTHTQDQYLFEIQDNKNEIITVTYTNSLYQKPLNILLIITLIFVGIIAIGVTTLASALLTRKKNSDKL